MIAVAAGRVSARRSREELLVLPSGYEPGPERVALRFAEAVKSAFSFLGNCGFRCVVSESTFVRFEAGERFVNVFHGRMSFEVGVEVGVTSGREEETFCLGALLRLVDPDRGKKYRRPSATTPEDVDQWVRAAAGVFLEVGRDFMAGSREVIEKLRREVRAIAEEIALDSHVAQTRPIANEAFRAKRYDEAARLFESIRRALTQAEVQKLEYALRHRQAKS